MENIWIYLEDGTFLSAKSFGASGTQIGELVFNTSMSGYQEIVSDPSYAGQFITFTMPEIGIVGANEIDMESLSLHCKGVLVLSYNEQYSNYRAEQSLAQLLKKHGILGICDIDTRYITKLIRDNGSMAMVASTTISDKKELKKELEKSAKISEINYIKQVTTTKAYIHKFARWNFETKDYQKGLQSDKKIIVIDFGVKRNILNELTNSGLEVEVIPSNFKASDLIAQFSDGKIGGIFLSNGPGDPLTLDDEIKEIKKLITANIPMFGICLGHQLLSIAHGYDTYKLKFGQHGGNHPVFCNDIVEITSQNHNYNVPDEIEKIADITHINLFDKTIEGVRYKDKPIFSLQHHPEASPGPHESRYVFDEFAKMVKTTS